MTNPLRAKVNAFCRANGICTSCYGRAPKQGCVQCEKCHARKRAEKGRARERYLIKHKEYYQKNKEKKKEYANANRHKYRVTDIEKAVKLVDKIK